MCRRNARTTSSIPRWWRGGDFCRRGARTTSSMPRWWVVGRGGGPNFAALLVLFLWAHRRMSQRWGILTRRPKPTTDAEPGFAFLFGGRKSPALEGGRWGVEGGGVRRWCILRETAASRNAQNQHLKLTRLGCAFLFRSRNSLSNRMPRFSLIGRVLTGGRGRVFLGFSLDNAQNRHLRRTIEMIRRDHRQTGRPKPAPSANQICDKKKPPRNGPSKTNT